MELVVWTMVFEASFDHVSLRIASYSSGTGLFDGDDDISLELLESSPLWLRGSVPAP